MIPTVSHLLYRVHHERQYWLTRAEKRRAFVLACGLIFVIATGILLWMIRH
jgi:hypothetical protein